MFLLHEFKGEGKFPAIVLKICVKVCSGVLTVESDGEREVVVVSGVGGGGEGGGMSQLRMKMKELSAARDVVVRNR